MLEVVGVRDGPRHTMYSKHVCTGEAIHTCRVPVETHGDGACYVQVAINPDCVCVCQCVEASTVTQVHWIYGNPLTS